MKTFALALVAAGSVLALSPLASPPASAGQCVRVCSAVPVAKFCRTPFGVRIACGVKFVRVCSIPRVCW